MKALVFEEPRRAVVRDLDVPTIAADEVLVRSRNVGICHSDFELYEGRYIIPVSYPIIPGHEWSGEIAEVGSGVTSAARGRPRRRRMRRQQRRRPLRLLDQRRRRRVLRRQGVLAAPHSRRALVRPGRVRRAVLGRLQRVRRRGRDRRERRGRGDRRRADRPALRDGGGDDGRLGDADRAAGASPRARARDRRASARSIRAPAPLAEQVAEATGGRGFDVVIEAAGAPAAMASAFPIAALGARVVLVGIDVGGTRARRDRARAVEGAPGARDHRLRRAVAAHDPLHGDERRRPDAAADGDVPARRRNRGARRGPRHEPQRQGPDRVLSA